MLAYAYTKRRLLGARSCPKRPIHGMPIANVSMDAYIAGRFELDNLGRIYGPQRAIVVG
jgi:hypothetical protein